LDHDRHMANPRSIWRFNEGAGGDPSLREVGI